VLVGGRSSRMGRDKALIEIDRVPLVQRVAAAIGEVCGSVSLVGDPALYGNLGFRVIPDLMPGEGPLAGIEAALGETKAEWNLVVACDMPALDTRILEELFVAAASNNGDCAAPQYSDGRMEPLCAVWNARCHAEVVSALADGVRKVTEALRRLALRYVPVASDAAFRNLNTPEDLERYGRG
jgi:molybdopterin-guanine dinucleotide biosynthesis protein A